MSVSAARTPPFTPRKVKGHVRSVSDPVPSTGTTNSRSCFSSDESDDDTDDAVDSLTSSSETNTSCNASPSAATTDATLQDGSNPPFHVQETTRVVAPKLFTLGHQAVAYSMPSIKVSHDKLRAAQCYFPPEMCVFVGNLPAAWEDGMLTRAVKYEFGHFGPCTVGVFRKVAAKPYAIVQYTDMNDAMHAMVYGNGLWMERRLRVEWSARARL